MFICAACGESKQKGQLVVMEEREKVYYGVKPSGEVYEQGRGHEIVRELRFCQDCLDESAGIQASEDALNARLLQ